MTGKDSTESAAAPEGDVAPSDQDARICLNCSFGFAAAPDCEEYAICLRDAEFEPFVSDILERMDFSGCGEIARRKRFPWNREACEGFERVERIEIPDGVAAKLVEAARKGPLTAEAFERAVILDAYEGTDWKSIPVEDLVRQLRMAEGRDRKDSAISELGALIHHGNRAAFDALADELKGQRPHTALEQTHFKCRLLTQLEGNSDFAEDLARILADDLLRTPSNNHTRGWYTAVFHFFERAGRRWAREALSPLLESPQFSYRVRLRIRGLVDRSRG